MSRRTAALPLSLTFLLAAFSQAQDRQDWSRGVQPRPDRTIFAPLDLPSPNAQRTASGAPGPGYWQQQVDYRIEVALDPETRKVSGKERVTYTNHSPEPLEYLWIHLEQNLFKKDSISSLVEGGRSMGGASSATEGMKVHEITSQGKPLAFSVYDTLARVELPAPVAAGGGKLELDVAWEFTVPTRVFRRYGTLKVRKGTVWELAQWFPAVAVFDDVHGWNTLPYLGGGEFYTNFGTFDVAIKAPRDHLVVATGVLTNPEEVYTEEQRKRIAQARQSAETVMIRGEGEVGDAGTRPAGEGPLTWRFHAEKVRTFAWASSEAFILDAASLGDTLLQSAYYAEVKGAWSKSTQMLRAAIGGYSKRWFPYPYPMATNVAGVEGGMEYPMIIFCVGRTESSLYEVTTHEIGHTWFPMVVNTDERRHAWMDEGFNTFINEYSPEDYFGPRGRGRRGGMAMGATRLPIMTPADQLDGGLLGVLEYFKTKDGLKLLREEILGPERFDFAFRTYIRRWAFKSPQPADFFRTMEDAAGVDLAWFWRGWFAEGAKLDQAVEGVDGRQITFTNLGRMVMPLRYKVTFDDDSTEEQELPVQVWFHSDRVTRTVGARKAIKEVQIDPQRAFPDTSRRNNTWKRPEPESRPHTESRPESSR